MVSIKVNMMVKEEGVWLYKIVFVGDFGVGKIFIF